MISMESIIENFPDMLFITGYDDCIVGVIDKIGSEPCICYDTFKILRKLEAQGMSSPDADEYFQFNILGSFVGEHTPCFLEYFGEDYND